MTTIRQLLEGLVGRPLDFSNIQYPPSTVTMWNKGEPDHEVLAWREMKPHYPPMGEVGRRIAILTDKWRIDVVHGVGVRYSLLYWSDQVVPVRRTKRSSCATYKTPKDLARCEQPWTILRDFGPTVSKERYPGARHIGTLLYKQKGKKDEYTSVGAALFWLSKTGKIVMQYYCSSQIEAYRLERRWESMAQVKAFFKGSPGLSSGAPLEDNLRVLGASRALELMDGCPGMVPEGLSIWASHVPTEWKMWPGEHEHEEILNTLRRVCMKGL